MFAALHLKKLMEYKVDFAIGAVGFLVEQVVNIAFLSIIFGRVESLRGWNYYEVLFIYGSFPTVWITCSLTTSGMSATG